MRVFYFGRISGKTSIPVLLEIGKVVSEENVEVFLTVRSLGNRLQEISAVPELFVLSPSTREELVELVALKNLFGTLPIILILPDQQLATIRFGHLLQPRFLSFWDSDFKELAQVIEKIHTSITTNNRVVI